MKSIYLLELKDRMYISTDVSGIVWVSKILGMLGLVKESGYHSSKDIELSVLYFK